jgi:2-iminobutanoate/2-iminopropanoate deaminase
MSNADPPRNRREAMKQVINPQGLAAPGGQYSYVVRKGNHVFLAGHMGLDADGRLVASDVGSQTRRAIENIRTSLAAVGASLEDVCTVQGYLADLAGDFAGYDAAFREFFRVDPPARATVGAALGLGALVEITAVAIVD